MTGLIRIQHDATVARLAIELSLAIAGATLVSGLIARWRWPWFLGAVIGAVGLFVPALVAALLLGRTAGTTALIVALLPILAWGWRRMPAGQWRTARRLGGSRLLIARVLIVPSLAPFLLAAILLGGAVLGLRWRLETHPAPITLPDPVTATG